MDRRVRADARESLAEGAAEPLRVGRRVGVDRGDDIADAEPAVKGGLLVDGLQFDTLGGVRFETGLLGKELGKVANL